MLSIRNVTLYGEVVREIYSTIHQSISPTQYTNSNVPSVIKTIDAHIVDPESTIELVAAALAEISNGTIQRSESTQPNVVEMFCNICLSVVLQPLTFHIRMVYDSDESKHNLMFDHTVNELTLSIDKGVSLRAFAHPPGVKPWYKQEDTCDWLKRQCASGFEVLFPEIKSQKSILDCVLYQIQTKQSVCLILDIYTWGKMYMPTEDDLLAIRPNYLKYAINLIHVRIIPLAMSGYSVVNLVPNIYTDRRGGYFLCQTCGRRNSFHRMELYLDEAYHIEYKCHYCYKAQEIFSSYVNNL